MPCMHANTAQNRANRERNRNLLVSISFELYYEQLRTFTQLKDVWMNLLQTDKIPGTAGQVVGVFLHVFGLMPETSSIFIEPAEAYM